MEGLINQLKEAAARAFEEVKTMDELEALRIRFLGKNGELTNILKSLSTFSDDERKVLGAEGNKLKNYITERISELKNELENSGLKNKFDITLPGKEFEEGTYHPITIIQRELEEIFKGMGFMIADTNEVETDYYSWKMLQK